MLGETTIRENKTFRFSNHFLNFNVARTPQISVYAGQRSFLNFILFLKFFIPALMVRTPILPEGIFFGHTLDLENFHEIFFRIMLCTYPGYWHVED